MLKRHLFHLVHTMLEKIAVWIPKPVKNILKTLGLDKILQLFYDKYDHELMFQKGWAREFTPNKDRVLDYWKKYRYLDDIEKICKIREDSKVLDVGCGVSTVLQFIKGKRFGIDPLADEYSKLYEYPEGVHVSKALGESIPFDTDYFDIVFCSNVLDHVTSPEKAINEILRVLKRDGYFVLTVEIFEEKMKRTAAHPHLLGKKEIYSLLEDRFETIFEKESPWIGMRNYVNGLNSWQNHELVLVLKKCKDPTCA